MDYLKINVLIKKIELNKRKLRKETDRKKREILTLRISIDELKIRIERLKD
jgi:hypothetical protein